MDLTPPRRQKGESVTLLSYANNYTGSRTISNGYVHRFTSNNIVSNGSNFYAVAPPCIVKKSEKFLRTFRKRSKSASRLRASESTDNLAQNNDCNSNFGGSVLTLHEDSFYDQSLGENEITYVANGERAKNPDKCVKPEKVTLVGFATKSTCDLFHLTNEGSNELDLKYQGTTKQSGFSTLKTSREVKMERERLRQERQQKSSQETKDWFDSKIHQDTNIHQKSFHVTSAQLEEELARFFEETRQKFHSRMTSSGEVFNQFVQDNREKLSQLNHQLQQQQQKALLLSLTGSHSSTSQQQNETLSEREKEEVEGRESWQDSDSVVLSSTSATPLFNVSHGQRNSEEVSSRALLHHGSHLELRKPSTAEVVASLLSERCHTTRRPAAKKRLSLSKSNNLNIINSHNNIVTTNCQQPMFKVNIPAQTVKVIQECDSKIRTPVSKVVFDGKSEQSVIPTNEICKEVKSRGEVVQKVDTLKRSNSGSSGLSSSSSGFSSLAGDNILFHSSPIQSKFRQLLEKRNTCDHHITFADHFVGFDKFNTAFLNSQSRGGDPGSSNNNNNYPLSNFSQQSLSEEGQTSSCNLSLVSQSSSSDMTKSPKVFNPNGTEMTEPKSPIALISAKESDDGTTYR